MSGLCKNAVVVAHFDPNDRLDENFRLILCCLETVFDSIVLVTTCNLAESETTQFKKVVTIRRPNIGYDFYSYRVGLDYLNKHVETLGVLLMNSSFLVTNTKTFTQLLLTMLKSSQKHGVVGVTESLQISKHLQSYLLLLNNKVYTSKWFKHFFDNVQPLNSKFEIIINYEIGLSKKLVENNVELFSLYQPDIQQRRRGEILWMKSICRTNSWFSCLMGKPLRHRREVNWVHFGALEIAEQFGIVKSELLRTNPHDIPTDDILRLHDQAIQTSIDSMLGASISQYQLGLDGLTTLSSRSSPLPISRVVQYGRRGLKGVRVAVVIHLYYFDLLDEICSYLKNIIEPFDLYVTTPFEGDVHKIINKMWVHSQSVTVHLTENRGRDIGPFVSLYRSGSLNNYLAVLKLHSKKSKYSTQGDLWRKQIYNSLVGEYLTIRQTLSMFESDKVGLVGPHLFYLSHPSFWGGNRQTVKNILKSLGLLESEPELGFFAGSMFWFSPKAFSLLNNIPVMDLNFEPEDGAQDGTLAHSLERVFCSIVKANGYKVTSSVISGVEISDIDTQDNKVPVL